MTISIIIVVGIAILSGIGFAKLHNKNIERLNAYNQVVTFDEMDDVLCPITERYKDSNNDLFDYVYKGKSIPLGRATAFLNFFGKSIYTEEPYMFLCKRSSQDDEFREYGCLFGRTGIYLSDENANQRGKDKYISFFGLSQILVIGKLIITVNVRPQKMFDSIRIYSAKTTQVANLIRQMGKSIINNSWGYALYKGKVVEIIDLPLEDNDDVAPYQKQTVSQETEDILDKTEKRLEGKGLEKGVEAAGVQAVIPNFKAFWGDIKNLMNGARGHGYAAEYGNNAGDRMKGARVEYAAQNLDEHGRQVKHGADRIVNGIEIQTKYYKTASETIGAVFQKKQAIYLRSDGSGKMMQIEVPRDQYQDALNAMQKRIDSGQVPNVSPGESAKDYVRKGYFTYEQSFNIARAGTIESLSVDIASGAVCCLQAAGISSIIIFAQAMWRGASPKEAMQDCLHTSMVIMGRGTLIYTLTMQLSRKEIANVFAGKVYTVDGIAQGYKAFNNPIFSASENMAAKISSSGVASSKAGQALGLDKMTGRRLIGTSVTVAVVFGPDVIKTLRGRISTKQLFKNTTIGAAGMAGAAIGQAAIPIPVVGAMIGGTVGGLGAKKVMDRFIEDDAKEMFRILKEEFIDQTMLSNLSKEEFDKVTALTVASKKASKLLEDMYHSKDYRNYARDHIMQPAILKVTKNRNLITQNQYDQALIEMAEEAVLA